MYNLDKALSEIIPNTNKPTNLELIYYIFWKQGISIELMCKLPIPYIFNIVKTHGYIKEEESKAMKKAGKR